MYKFHLNILNLKFIYYLRLLNKNFRCLIKNYFSNHIKLPFFYNYDLLVEEYLLFNHKN